MLREFILGPVTGTWFYQSVKQEKREDTGDMTWKSLAIEIKIKNSIKEGQVIDYFKTKGNGNEFQLYQKDPLGFRNIEKCTRDFNLKTNWPYGLKKRNVFQRDN